MTPRGQEPSLIPEPKPQWRPSKHAVRRPSLNMLSSSGISRHTLTLTLTLTVIGGYQGTLRGHAHPTALAIPLQTQTLTAHVSQEGEPHIYDKAALKAPYIPHSSRTVTKHLNRALSLRLPMMPMILSLVLSSSALQLASRPSTT